VTAKEGIVRNDVYHPDPEINAEVAEAALEAERIDLAAGYPPRRWYCPDCGANHQRGHFMTIGIHRCLGCGYVGEGGTMHTEPGEGDVLLTRWGGTE
jgi:rubredoxin